MTDPARPLPFVQFIRGRSSRGEFWLSVGGLFVFNFAMGLVGAAMLASLLSLPVWIIIGARRLHDFGQTGWWAVIPAGVGFVLGFLAGLGLPLSQMTIALLNGAVALLSVIVIGSTPGAPGLNRFGWRREKGQTEVSQVFD